MYMEEIVIEHPRRGILAKYLISEARKCKTIIVNSRSLIERELINFLSGLIKLKLKTYPDKSIDLIKQEILTYWSHHKDNYIYSPPINVSLSDDKYLGTIRFILNANHYNTDIGFSEITRRCKPGSDIDLTNLLNKEFLDTFIQSDYLWNHNYFRDNPDKLRGYFLWFLRNYYETKKD